MKPTEAAWAAGLFEGEGCITRSERPYKGWPGVGIQYTLKLSMTDEDVVRKFATLVGHGAVHGPHQATKGTKPYYVWEATKKDVVRRILTAMLPHFGQRRSAKALEAIAWTHEVYTGRSHCKRGHEFTPENTRVTSQGHRRCRICHADWRAEQANKAARP